MNVPRRSAVVLMGLLVMGACSDDDPAEFSGPTIAVTQTAVTFLGEEGSGDPAAQEIAVTDVSGGTLSNLGVTTTYMLNQPTGWLTATLASATSPSTLMLAPSTASLAPGTYTAVVMLSAPGAINSPRGVVVTLNVEGASGPHVFSYTPPAGAPAITSISVRGSFNGWGETPMTLVGDTWSVALPLDEGAYEYKFYINETWPDDMCNDETWGLPTENQWIDPDADECVGGNAKVTVDTEPTHIFIYTPPAGAPEVTSVSLRGEMNGWGETPMIKLGNSWRIGIDEPGTYEYKFFINGSWPDDMCNDATWGHPDQNLWIDPDADQCVNGNAEITIN
jgi:hypothetical protein